MNESVDRSLVSGCRSFSRAAGLIAALTGALVLAGWLVGSGVLKTALPGGAPMRANAAVCFILCGVALWLMGRESRGAARRIGQCCAVLAALIGLATLAEYLFGINLGIDQLLFREAPGPGVAHPGRMPLLAAVNFVLLGCALLLLDAETRRGRRPAQLLALPAGLIAFLAAFDYALDLEGDATGMALHGAALFGLLSLGVLLARPEKGVTAVLVSPRVGGMVARRLLPSCVAALVVVAWLRWMGQRVGLYGTKSGVILMVTSAVAVIVVLIWVNARALDRADKERERDGEALREAYAYNRSLIEASFDPVVTIDAEGKIGDANRATELATGFSRQHLVGKDFCDYFTEPERARAVYQQVFETGQVRDYELLLRRRDGHTTPVLYNAAVYHDQSGQVRGVFAAARDTTEQQRAAQEVSRLNAELERRVVERTAELEATNKELEAFTSSVSHDLRAPLRHIDGFSRLLLEKHSAALPVEARHYLERVREGTRRMGALVDDLLDLARLGRKELSLQVTGLKTLAEQARAELQPETEGRSIEWHIGALPFVDCDPALLKQVFMNLISNAIKFTRPRQQAVIEIGQAVENGRVAVYVRDNGIGFSMKYRDKLFKVFQRLHRAEDFEGTGVGLAAVQRIIHKHGGQVWAEGELDKGATFYFALEAGAADSIENRAAAPEGGAQ
jgi:PAS domain S-box-containing protein